MDKSENGRMSRRVGWIDEPDHPQFYTSSWQQKVSLQVLIVQDW